MGDIRYDSFALSTLPDHFMKKILLLLLAFTAATCSDSPVSTDPAPHHDLIYTVAVDNPVAIIMRARSDGSNREVVTSGRLVAAPVRGKILLLGPGDQELFSGTVDG